MSIPTVYSFIRYLAAKKSVDDRALNRCVWHRLVEALPVATPDSPVRVLEVGAGIGTMVERVLEQKALTYATYTAIDTDPDTMAEACRRLPRWAANHSFRVREEGRGRLRLQHDGQDIRVEAETIDLFDFIGRERGTRVWDLCIAHAVLDLLNVPETLPSLFSVLRPGGLFYCTVTFDGVTIFQPEIDPVLDTQIEALYHQTMDNRRVMGRPSGDSRAGRHLFGQVRAAGAELRAAGSSDWVVFAGPEGYPADEAYFLHFIIHTIYTALASHPQLAAERFAAWIAERHAQVEQGTLVYIAHQLDLLGCLPSDLR